ncbi:hypothetical protein PIB30_018307 [Stylosanthes scabra]|uniref:Uncharacterized protein n=1 Tax=Stylosanthes scabra TaxID=79078 RepID=A0ABU6Z4G5_9FABA|nr:hypothetical protein [Stylosanthes scabra]
MGLACRQISNFVTRPFATSPQGLCNGNPTRTPTPSVFGSSYDQKPFVPAIDGRRPSAEVGAPISPTVDRVVALAKSAPTAAEQGI